MTLQSLIQNIHQAHQLTRHAASLSVNQYLIQRNWLIGYYLIAYEQQGEDRASYGQKILEKLAHQLTQTGIKGMSARSLRQYRQFYLAYPQIWQTLSAKFPLNLPAPELNPASELLVPPDTLLNHLSYSHFVELIKQEDPLKRALEFHYSLIGFDFGQKVSVTDFVTYIFVPGYKRTFSHRVAQCGHSYNFCHGILKYYGFGCFKYQTCQL